MTWARSPTSRPGFQDLERDDKARARFEAAWDAPIRPRYGWHLTQMFEAMERGELRTLYVIGENPAQSEADISRARRLLSELDLLVVQDIVMTRTAEMADVVLPGTASWCEAEGTVTNSERRVQRVRKALEPPGGPPGTHIWILAEARTPPRPRLGDLTAEEAWTSCVASPLHRGTRNDRLDGSSGGSSGGAPTRSIRPLFLDARLWAEPVEGPRAPFSVVEARPLFEALTTSTDPPDDRRR